MRAVLYAYDLEPITVLELTPLAWDFLVERGVVRLPVPPQPSLIPSHGSVPRSFELRTVTIHAETFVRDRQRSLMLFTHDEETALLLKSALLPGQIKDHRDAERAAWARGFMAALDSLGM